MSSAHPASYAPPVNPGEIAATPSRLMDEKISDESGTEATENRVFAPAGLDNPFWK